MKQDIRSGSLDILTVGEFSTALHAHRESWFSRYNRERFRGINLRRIPPLVQTAPSAAFVLQSPTGEAPCGPESGWIWRIHSLLFETSNQGSTTTTAVLQQVALGASTVATSNLNPFNVQVVVSGGTVTQITINGVNTGQTSGTFLLKPGDLIANTNTVPPTYTTTLPVGTALPSVTTVNDPATGVLFVSSDPTLLNTRAEADRKGFLIGQRYAPPKSGLWVYPGEQIYVSVSGASTANQYSLTGIVAEVPMEMVGKII